MSRICTDVETHQQVFFRLIWNQTWIPLHAAKRWPVCLKQQINCSISNLLHGGCFVATTVSVVCCKNASPLNWLSLGLHICGNVDFIARKVSLRHDLNEALGSSVRLIASRVSETPPEGIMVTRYLPRIHNKPELLQEMSREGDRVALGVDYNSH